MSKSAIYEGWVAHRRLDSVAHSFRYPVFMPLFDLGELPELLDDVPFWSARGPAPARLCCGDFLGDQTLPLSERARQLACDRLGRRPAGPVRLLANPRYLGVGFNPISLFFLFARDGRTLEAVIAEVTNTPWRDRTAYVLDAHERDENGATRACFDKQMRVSPFQPMDQRYQITVSDPADDLRVAISNFEGDREVFRATLAVRRRELTRARLAGMLLRYPPMTIATLGRIYANALRLRLKGAPLHRNASPSVSPAR